MMHAPVVTAVAKCPPVRATKLYAGAASMPREENRLKMPVYVAREEDSDYTDVGSDADRVGGRVREAAAMPHTGQKQEEQEEQEGEKSSRIG